MKKYLLHLKRNNYSKNTIRTYKSILSIYMESWKDIRNIKRKILKYKERPNTIATHYSVILAYMKFTRDKRMDKFKGIKLPYKSNLFRPIVSKGDLYRKTNDLSKEKILLSDFCSKLELEHQK